MHNNLNNKLNNLTPKINFSLCDMDYTWTSLQQPPWGQKEVAIVERWPLVEVRLYHKKKNVGYW